MDARVGQHHTRLCGILDGELGLATLHSTASRVLLLTCSWGALYRLRRGMQLAKACHVPHLACEPPYAPRQVLPAQSLWTAQWQTY